MTYTEKRLEEFDERCLIVRARGKGEGKFRPVVYWDNEEQEDAENIKSFLIASITQAITEDREKVRGEIEKQHMYTGRDETDDDVISKDKLLSSLDKPLTDNKE